MATSTSSCVCIPHQTIPLRDGTRLAAKLWLPACSKQHSKHSALLEYIPYRKYDGTYQRDNVNMRWFASHADIVGVRVDIQGSGDSSGALLDEYLRSEQVCCLAPLLLLTMHAHAQEHGVEIIDWMAQQPWSNGKVFMIGKSWAGFNSLQIAALNRTPHLRGIIPLHFSHNRFQNDIHFMGGCLLTANMSWSGYMLAQLSLPPSRDLLECFEKWKAVYRERLERNNGPWIHQWLRA